MTHDNLRVFVLEDDGSRMHWFFDVHYKNADHASNAAAAIELLGKNTYDLIWLDHDLGDATLYGTGADVARFIADSGNTDAYIVVHSWNPAGADNMMSILKDCSRTYARPIGMISDDERRRIEYEAGKRTADRRDAGR